MENQLITKTFLLISGLIVLGIGGALLFDPINFQASVDIHLGTNLSLLSDTRASGGLMFAGGSVIILGVFNRNKVPAALLISCLFYLSYGTSRTFSMIVDGLPHTTLIVATGLEIILGLVSLFMLLKIRKPHAEASTL